MQVGPLDEWKCELRPGHFKFQRRNRYVQCPVEVGGQIKPEVFEVRFLLFKRAVWIRRRWTRGDLMSLHEDACEVNPRDSGHGREYNVSEKLDVDQNATHDRVRVLMMEVHKLWHRYYKVELTLQPITGLLNGEQ